MLKQYTIYDMDIETDRRPCRYKFHRYIGQKVRTRFGICTITNINGPYYTDMKDEKGRLWVGTPHDISPVEEDSI